MLKRPEEEVLSEPDVDENQEAIDEPQPTTQYEVLLRNIKVRLSLEKLKTDGTPVEVIPGVYIGSIGAALNSRAIEELGINYVLCCGGGLKPRFPKLCKYKTLELLDKPDEDASRYFEQASTFIKKVLIHGFAGKSRAVTMLIA